jgi:hypothetical protein
VISNTLSTGTRIGGSLKEILIIAQKQPTSIIHYAYFSRGSDAVATILKRERKLMNFNRYKQVSTIIMDTYILYDKLGKSLPKCSVGWDFDTWKLKHDVCVEQLHKLKFSKDIFPWCQDYPKEFSSKCGGYLATLLYSMYDIQQEGENMHHCVGVYGDRVKAQKYFVISIKDIEGNSTSTLGCEVVPYKDSATVRVKGTMVEKQQHYAKWNKSVNTTEEKVFADEIIKTLNYHYDKVMVAINNNQQ